MDKAYSPCLLSYLKKRYKSFGKLTQEGVDVSDGSGNAVLVTDGEGNIGNVGRACSVNVELGKVAGKEVP